MAGQANPLEPLPESPLNPIPDKTGSEEIMTSQVNTERLKFCVKYDCCKTITIEDCTQWQLFELADSQGFVKITLPNEEVFEFNITQILQAVTEISECKCIELIKLKPQDFGLEKFEDGKYTIDYIAVYDEQTTYLAKQYFYNYCNVRCCVNKFTEKTLNNYLKNCNPCNPCDEFLNTTILQQLFIALKNAILMYDFVQADKLREKIENICKLKKCNC